MHLWRSSGHTRGPWGEQGRQESAGCSSDLSRGPRGPKPNAGTVGPKIATTGVPTAVARWSGAESLVTSTAPCSRSAAEARSGSPPVGGEGGGRRVLVTQPRGVPGEPEGGAEREPPPGDPRPPRRGLRHLGGRG